MEPTDEKTRGESGSLIENVELMYKLTLNYEILMREKTMQGIRIDSLANRTSPCTTHAALNSSLGVRVEFFTNAFLMNIN